MTEEERLAEEKARQAQREADLVKNRIEELREDPIKGKFDAEHLKAIHAHIFQDFPHHRPGVVRDDTAETWVKHRALEGTSAFYDVPYVSQGVEAKVAEILDQFGGADSIKGLNQAAAAARIAELYGALDHAHAFYEGNSRTLREFTRELASESGYALDWVKAGVGIKERNALYAARDLAVLERAYPDLTPERAMQTNDLAEYEASFVIAGLRRAVGGNTLAAIIRDGLSPEKQRERGQERDDASPIKAMLFVFDAVTGVVETLADFVLDFLGGGASPKQPQDPATVDAWAEVKAQRKAAAALDNIRESMERGESLSASDVQHLTPTHLQNIARHGDDYLRQLIERMERDRQRENDWGRERER